MIVLISGGSGSGKSELAESLTVKLSNGKDLIYIATMKPYGTETLKKIEHHKLLRCNKNFLTLEVYQDLHNVNLNKDSTILLECLSNLLANETFSDNPSSNVYDKILMGINHLKGTCKNMVIVSNEVFSDGCHYDASTLNYIKDLARLNRSIAKFSDVVIECVYSNMIVHKGEILLNGLV